MANPTELLQITVDEIAGVMRLLEAEPTSAPGNSFPAVSTQPDIPALREELAVLVSTGKAKETIGVQLTHEDVKRLTDKEVEKYTKRYEAYESTKTNDNLIDSLICFVSKLVGMGVDLDDIKAYQKEIKNDYIIIKELSNLAGRIAMKCGRLLAVANFVLITTKYINLEKNYEAKSEEIIEQSSPTAE